MRDFREKKEMHEKKDEKAKEKKYQALHMTPDVREAKRLPPAPPRFEILMEDELGKRRNNMNKNTIRRIYHKLIRKEWEKYNTQKTLNKVFLTREDFQNLEISDEMIDLLLHEGLLLQLTDDKFRTLLMDLAFRASDIRIKHGGTKYVLESELKLISRPLLHHSYVLFDRETKELENLKNSLLKVVNDKNIVDLFLSALMDAGIKGLSKYQYWSIIEFLDKNQDAVISAPTAFGKTYCFILPVLIEAVKNAKEDYRKTLAVIFYPRKSLGSDQMGKLIRLIYHINKKCGAKITIGIDDGEVRKKDYLQEGREFRGIKCPIHADETLIIKNKKVYCRKCSQYFDFICLSRQDFLKKPPTILITNIWTYQYRLSEPKYWKNGYINEDIKFFILDEVHAYRSLVAGMIRYLIKIIKHLVSPNARLVLSSATIPKLEEFVYEITGSELKDMLNLIYDERYHGKDSEKLELYLLLGINPYTSWETYTHELAIFLSTVNRLRKNKNLQSLIFVDSIKNINRLYDQAREAVKLGDPKDHFSSFLSPEDPFCFWIYNEDFKTDPKNIETSSRIENLRKEILENLGYHYSQLPDRFEVEERIKNGTIDVVFSTSTLELGVDYDNVSVIVNAGIPRTVESIVQRVGRAGRKEETTFNTSLSIIIVRNNPLEYFYIYKGIENLVDPNLMSKIPVSYTNQFVVFYSIMLYIISLFAKKGKRLKGDIETFESLLDYFNKNKNNVISSLEITVDITRLNNEIENLIRILKDKSINEICREVYSYINSIWIYRELEGLKSDLEEFIRLLKEKIRELPKREKPIFEKKFDKLKDSLIRLKSSRNLDDTKDVLYDLISILDETKNLIRGSVHPMYSFRNDFFEMSKRSESYVSEIEKIGSVTRRFRDDECGLYAKACEIHKNISDKIIELVENIIGFKFMGNEFIDQTIFAKPEFEVGKGEPISITNLITRMPPFELINIPFEDRKQRDITKLVGARHFWFPKPKNYFIYDDFPLLNYLRENQICKGFCERFKDILVPNSIEFIDLIGRENPLIIRIRTKWKGGQQNLLFLKYGSDIISKTKIKNRYLLNDNIKLLYTTLNSKYDIIKEATLNTLRRLDKDVQSHGNRWGLNFRYAGMCGLGICISTDPYDLRCPPQIQRECKLCDGNKYWIKKRKIFPKFYMKVSVKNLPEERMPLVTSLETRTYEEMKEDIEFIYDTVYAYLPIRFGDYMLREIEIEPLGYTAKTSYISLKFNPVFIEILIDNLLNSNKELLELLKFKFYMYTQYKLKASSLDASLMCLKYDSKKINTDKGFREFVANSLIHTIAHLFYTFLAVEKVNIDPDRMIYFIEDYNIYILENSKNDGIGIVETIRSEIERKGKEKILNEFYKWCDNFLNTHNRRVIYLEQEIKKESKNFIKTLVSDKEIGNDIKGILDELDKLNKEISSKVPLKFVDLITYRHIISHQLQIPEELSEYLLTIINAQDEPHMCFDGCDDCLIFSSGCSEPFAQVYSLSKRLVLDFLRIILQKNIPVLKRGIGKIIENLMKVSQQMIIKTPFIDEFGIRLLERMKNSGKEIMLITRESNPNYLRHLEEIGINIIISRERFHTKIYYFNINEEEICIQGSVNLTRNSFYENEENITLFWDKSQILNILKTIGVDRT